MKMPCVAASLYLLMSAALIGQSLTAKVLLLPGLMGSHVNFFSLAAEILKSDGHQVDSLVLKEFSHMMTKKGIKSYAMEDKHMQIQRKKDSEMMINKSKSVNSFQRVMLIRMITLKMSNAFTEVINTTLTNQHLMKELFANNYDMIIVDGIDYTRCLYVIAGHLKVPYVTLNARHDPWSAGMYSSPASEGMMGLHILEIDSFVNRLISLAMYLGVFYGSAKNSISAEFCKRYTDTSDIGVLYKRSEMFFCNRESIFLQTPRMQAPHYRFLGGLGAHPAQPLPSDLEKYVTSAGKHGVIVLSFGSGISSLSPVVISNIFVALSTLKQKVVMRLVGEYNDVPKNVKLMDWIPQNDLLGHKNTVLFFTHCGSNGLMEALYHGVPMALMPLLADQPINAKEAQRRGYGLILNSETSTSLQMTSILQRLVAKDNEFMKNVKKASQMFHSLPRAADEFKFWINHTITYGGSHLKPVSYDQPLPQAFMVDIMTFVFVVSLILLFLMYFIAKLVVRCIFCRKRSKPNNAQSANKKKKNN